MTSVSKTTWLNVGLILCGLFTRAQAADCPQVPEDYVVEHDGLKVYRDNPLDRCCRLENGDIWRQDQGEAWPRDRLVIDWSGFKAKTGNLDGYALTVNLRKKGGGTDPLWPVPWSLKLGETRMTMGYGLHQNSAVEVDGRKVDLSERNDFEGFNIIVRAPVEDPAVQASVDIVTKYCILQEAPTVQGG